MPKNCVLTSVYIIPCFKVKGQGQGKRSGSRSQVRVKFLVRSGRYWGLGFTELSAAQEQRKVKVSVCVPNNRADVVD